jgi:hypothetical protein
MLLVAGNVMETETIRLLATAAENIIAAAETTQDGVISELCANALEDVRRAMRRAVDGYEDDDQ